MTMLIMGVATFLIGLIPTYDAIGIAGADPAGGHAARSRASRSAASGAGRS